LAEPTSRLVDAAGVSLRVLTLGTGPRLLMLHGMRDVATSLLPIAEELARDYQVLLPDLRGHGGSDRPGNYAMIQFLFDLHKVVEELTDEPPALFGHSLGGQIIARYAALYPDQVKAAVIVEGLGPPARPHLADPATALELEGKRLIQTLATSSERRPLPDVEFAAQRLLANNPRLEPGEALVLARGATERDAHGNLVWAFDPRVGSVFLGLGHEDGERYWSHVICPTLIVTGAHCDEYWRGAVPGATDASTGFNGRFAPGELEKRLAMFRNHKHLAFDGSGHMVHFDEPARLARETHDFLATLG